MRFITQVLIFGFVAFCAASDEDALETPLKALIPRRFFEKLNNGWQRSLTALKVKDVFALPKIHARRSEMTSKAAVEEVIKSESPILLRVIKETGKQLVTKHDENMEKLDDQTKKFGASVFNAAKSFTSNMIKKFNAQSDTVKNDIKNVYPHTDKLIQVLGSKLGGGKREKRSADHYEYFSQFLTMLLTFFA